MEAATTHKQKLEAMQWFRVGAGMQHAGCMFKVATFYDEPGASRQDKARAATLFHEAAALGDADAQNSYGVCLQVGTGVAKNEARAVAMYRAATEQGHAEAMCNLALCLDQGIGGLAVNKAAAFTLFQRAADLGHANGYFYAAWCLRDGEGVAADAGLSATYAATADRLGCRLAMPLKK